MGATTPYFATCAKGLEPLLFDELQSFSKYHDMSEVQQTAGGCSFNTTLAGAYHVCLWSRLASRVLKQLSYNPVARADDIVAAVRSYPWEREMEPTQTLIIDFSGSHPEIRHTKFGAQLVKDGIVDRLREVTGQRPTITRDDPEIRINARLHKNVLTWYLDMSGDGLHRRGYRQQQGAAPLRETLAAGVLLRAGINTELSQEQPVMADLFCGSGTLVIEAAMMAFDHAPGLRREGWGFDHWRGHQADLWQSEVDAAEQRLKIGLERDIVFIGRDTNAQLVGVARTNAERLDFADRIDFGVADACQTALVPERGLLISNPPYGERLGEEVETLLLYRRLGQNLRQNFTHWQVALLAGDDSLLKRLKLRSHKKYKLFNGALEVVLALYDMREGQSEFTKSESDDLANRLKKNYQKLEKWAAKEGVNCWRLYDADLPEYNAAVDVYGDHLMIQEYAAPKDIPEAVAKDRLWHLIDTLSQTLPYAAEKMTLKLRQRQQGKNQYQKQQPKQMITQVHEYGAMFEVNLSDYLDSGLFLDHRFARREFAKLSEGKHVLNLFSYTCSASVHAALAEAESIVSVDISKTYLDWGRRNFALNQLHGRQYRFEQADCIQWLRDHPPQQRFDVIFLDPPTFSNSKRMRDTLDIQRDHIQMLKLAMRLLKNDGVILFSNNFRKFKLDVEALETMGLVATDLTSRSIPQDFARNRSIHHLFKISYAA